MALVFDDTEQIKRLDFLRKARTNPDLLIKKRVDQMLGRGGPPSPDDMGPY